MFPTQREKRYPQIHPNIFYAINKESFCKYMNKTTVPFTVTQFWCPNEYIEQGTC